MTPATPQAGKAWCPPYARAAVAIGADGLIVEVHPCPEKAKSDGAQSLNFPQFRSMMQELKPYLDIWKETRGKQSTAAKAAV